MTAAVSLALWVWALVWVGAVALIAIGWALHGAVAKATGETLDLSVAAARGELDLDWGDPRDYGLSEDYTLVRPWPDHLHPFVQTGMPTKPARPPVNPSNIGY